MIYELRIYQCVPGRLPVLLKRFEDHTLKIWEKHGIRQAGFWTVLIGDGSNDLHYLLAWESMAEREKVWGGRFWPIRPGSRCAKTPRGMVRSSPISRARSSSRRRSRR
jgi:NIPSNAP